MSTTIQDVTTDALALRYGTRDILRDVTLTMPARAISALIGPSGCGKTSFLTCLNRLTDLVPHCRVSGAVRVGDVDVLSRDTDVLSLRRRVGMVFQKPNPFPLTIWKNLALPLSQHGVRRAEREPLIEGVLRDVGLWDEVKDRLRTPAMALSGGQQQRLCIARALVLRPEVLLFDEPCSALDPLSSHVVEQLVASLRTRYTVVIVTHNLAQARRIADRLAVFWVDGGCGRLIEHGPADRVFEQPEHALTRAYLSGQSG